MKVDLKKYDPIVDIEDGVISCSNQDIALGFKIDYKERYSLSKDEFEMTHATWYKSLKNLPVGSIVVKSDKYTKCKFDTSTLPQTTYMQRATAQYFGERGYMKHENYIFFIFSKRDTMKNNSIKNPFIIPRVSQYKKEDMEIKAFIDEVKQIQQIAKISGMFQLIPLSEKEVESWKNFYFNGFQDDYVTDTYIKKDKIESDNIAGIFTLNHEKNFPDTIENIIEDKDYSSKTEEFVFYQGLMDQLGLHLDCNHIYNQIIFIDDHQAHYKAIHKNKVDLKGTARFNTQNGEDGEKVEGYLKEISNDSECKLIRGNNNIIFWCDTDKEFEYNKRKIQAELKNLDIMPYYPKKERLKSLYFNSFFANVSNLENQSMYMVGLHEALCLYVNSTNYKSEKEGIIFQERLWNVPVNFDFWDEMKRNLKSRNFMIVAPTGSGKSFAWAHILRQILEQGIIATIVDLGDSYLKFAKLLPEEDVAIFKYKEGEPLGLNPFSLNGPITTKKIEEVREFVWTLIRRNKEIADPEQAAMRKIIKTYYEMCEDYRWETFYYFVVDNKEKIYTVCDINDKKFFNIEEFQMMGSEFVGDGTYSFLFDTTEDNSQRFKGKKLILFELNEIKDNELLLSIMLQAISEAVDKAILSDKSKKGIVFFDEFAKQLEFEGILNKVAYYFQAIRKENGGVGIVLQSFTQLPQTEKAQSMIENAETVFVLKTEKEKYDSTIERLKLNKHSQSQLKSMKSNFSGKYPYSELAIKRNSYINIFRIEEPPEIRYAFQTEGEDHDRMMKIYEETGDMYVAIEEMVKSNT